MEKRYFHQLKTIEYAVAMKFYGANRSTMWKEEDGIEGEGRDNGKRAME